MIANGVIAINNPSLIFLVHAVSYEVINSVVLLSAEVIFCSRKEKSAIKQVNVYSFGLIRY